MSPLPDGLSAGSGALWRTLHASRDFSPDADEYLRRGLAKLDLSDELLGLAREKGFETPAGRGLLSASRDAALTGLKFLLATGLDKAALEALRRGPGRPPGRGWTNDIRPGPQPRDHLTGRPLRRSS